MQMKRLFMVTVAAMLMSMVGYAQEWQRLSAALMTPWGEQIDPENVWQEYPRPQLVRQDWMNLNGVWEYFRRSNTQSMSYVRTLSSFRQRILVPFGVESALSGIMHTDLGTTANSVLMYRRTFELTEAFAGKTTLLHFGAVDWRCVVYVNGEKVGQHDGGSDPFTFDITPYLKASGEQELQVAVWDPCNRGGQPIGKQTTSPGSIWYTSCSGIWQTVWLEPVNPCYIERYELVPDAEHGTVKVKVLASDPTCKFYLIARDGEEIVATTDKVRVGEEVTLTIPNAKLWSPDSPFLYNLDIYLTADNCQECDKARGYFGLRTLSKAMIDGHPGFLLNGKPLFLFGPLDQGWWPDGLLTPPSYEAMIYDLKTIKSLGMNMVRKHIKVENDLWYEWCDRNGLIVWQDMPSAGGSGGTVGTKEECQQIFYNECVNIVNAVKQHPSICVWIPFNEGWGQDAGAGSGHTMRGYLTVRNADADMGRLMNAASGWTDFEIGDITDAHSYPSPNGMSNTRNDRVNVCGEYGGITYLIDGHLWAGSQQVYTSVDDSEAYTERFNQFTTALQALQKTKGLWAGVYTQITDVEQEVNGILTYDRKVLKVNDEQLASLRSNIQKTIYQRLTDAVSVLKAGDNASNIYWRYTTTEPVSGWEQPGFDDSSWKRGLAGFGKIDQPDARVRTTWSTPEIWIRRQFVLDGVTADDLPNLCLRLFYDEDSEVYINGVLAMSITGYNTTYQLFGISQAARNAIILDGENTLAIHTKQTAGGQYIDAGFSLSSFQDNSELSVEPLADLSLPEFSEDPAKAYLFCYAKAGNPRLFYAYSLDGQTWQELNEGESIFGNTDTQPALQGPFIRRLEDANGNATFHLIHGGNGTSGLYHWTSDDLYNWKPLNGTDGKVVDTEAITPEMDFDTFTNYYVYYWTVPGNGQYSLRYSRTKDLVNYSRVTDYFTTGFSSRDLHTFKSGTTYVALFTDPDNQGLCSATSNSVNPARNKFQNIKKVFSSAHKIFSPTVVPSFDGNGWFLFGSEQGINVTYRAATASATNIVWHLYDTVSNGLPADADCGKMLVITRDELSNLNRAIADAATGVQHVRPDPHNPSAYVYDLKGVRVTTTPSKGIYISNGKKKFVQ